MREAVTFVTSHGFPWLHVTDTVSTSRQSLWWGCLRLGGGGGMGISLKWKCEGLCSLLCNSALVIFNTWVLISCCKMKSLPVSMLASSNNSWACFVDGVFLLCWPKTDDWCTWCRSVYILRHFPKALVYSLWMLDRKWCQQRLCHTEWWWILCKNNSTCFDCLWCLWLSLSCFGSIWLDLKIWKNAAKSQKYLKLLSRITQVIT